MSTPELATLVTGASGFVGRALVRALVARGERVIALGRTRDAAAPEPGVTRRVADLLEPATLRQAFSGARIAYYLVHSMSSGAADYRVLERRCAETFVSAAAAAGIERIVYLGGPAPSGLASEHLRSRLEVGEILRAGPVPTVELRAAMVIGDGSASFNIVRDLAMRLPIMVLPRWLASRTRPIALADVISALVAAAHMPLERSSWFDLPGPDILSGQQILQRIAALQGRRFIAVRVPFLSPRLSALASPGHSHQFCAGARVGPKPQGRSPAEGRPLLEPHQSPPAHVLRRRSASGAERPSWTRPARTNSDEAQRGVS